MKERQVRRSTAGLGALALVGLAGCTPSGGSSDGGTDGAGETEIVWAVGGARSQPGGANTRIADLWNEQNPDTPVRIEVLPEAADGAREQQALVLQAEGSEFDVLGLDVVWTGEYVENGWLASLEGVRPELEDALLQGPLESASWRGELWGAPLNTNTGVLYYRTDLVDGPPQTWQEICEAGAIDGYYPYIGQGAKYEGFVVNWLELYWSAGGEIYNEDQSEVLFDPELATEVTTFMADALAEGCFAPGYNTAMEEESRIAFQQGDVVFMRNWPGPYALIEDDTESPAHGNTALAPIPAFGDGEGVAAVGGFNNAVSAFSEHTDLATEFVVWAATDMAAQEILAEDAVLPVLQAYYDEVPDDSLTAELGEILQSARPRPSVPQWSEISLAMQDALFPAYNGDADPAEAAQSVREFLDGTIAG